MRRDHFTVEVRTAATGQPLLDISYDGPPELLTRQLSDEADELFESDTTDASFRLQDPLEESAASGVFSLTHRLTGEYLLEVNLRAAELLSMIQAVRDTKDDEDVSSSSYRIRISTGGNESVELEKEALFVYDSEGELLRQRSLIPSGVEL